LLIPRIDDLIFSILGRYLRLRNIYTLELRTVLIGLDSEALAICVYMRLANYTRVASPISSNLVHNVAPRALVSASNGGH